MSIAFTQRPPDYWSEVPSGASDFEFVYTSAIDYYWLFTNATVPAGTSFLEVTPTPPELGGVEWADGFEPTSVSVWLDHIYSATYTGDITVQFLDTGNNVVFSGSYAYTAGTSPGTQFVSGAVSLSGLDINRMRIVLDTPGAEMSLRVQQIEWTHEFDWLRVSNTDDYWTELDIYYGFPDAPYWSYSERAWIIHSESTISDSYIEFDYSAIVEPPVNASFYFKIPNPSGFQTKLDAIHSAGGTYGLRVNLRGATETLGTALLVFPEGIDLVANPYLSVDMAVDSTLGPIDNLELIPEKTGALDIESESIFLIALNFSFIGAVCTQKPVNVIYQEYDPGSPGFPGIPYAPAYCLPPFCRYVTTRVSSSPTITFETTCIQDEGVTGFSPTASCTTTTRSSSGESSTRSEWVCSPPICYPEQPAVPPMPAVAATPESVAYEYDLGWNFDVLIQAGRNIGVDIDNDNVSITTAGTYVGIAEAHKSTLSGLGKFTLAFEFIGNKVRLLQGATQVWGVYTRSISDVFSLEQYGDGVAAYLNDVLLYKTTGFWAGNAAIIATIYKGGDKVCLEYNTTSASTFFPNDGSADIDLPAFSASGYEGSSYSVADVMLPAPTVEATQYGDGEADIDLPAFFVFASEGANGYGDTRLPVMTVNAFAADAYLAFDGYGDATLPAMQCIAGDHAYGAADTRIPAIQVSSEGGYSVPAAQGCDATLQAFLQAGHGLTGGIGSVDEVLPAFLSLAGGGYESYGQAIVDMPTFEAIGYELPVYDGVLDGTFAGLEVQDFYGHIDPLNRISGDLEELAGGLEGGAYLAQDIPALAGELSGNIEVVGRLDGTFMRMTMNSTGLTGMYGELVGSLGDPLDGELLAGAFISGSIPGLVGELVATSGATGVIDATFQGLAGEVSGAWLNTGRLDATLPPIEALWGILEGTIVSLNGEFVESEVTVSEYVAWVMNLAHNGVTRYPAYPFDFVVRFQGKHYLANSSGIYELGAADDDGEPIDAEFGLPPSDFGSTQEKRCPRLYIKGKLGGQMAVSIQADEGDTYTSNTEGNAGVDYWRAKMPRGLKGHNLKFNVANVDGSDFEIEHVDALIHLLGRKI